MSPLPERPNAQQRRDFEKGYAAAMGTDQQPIPPTVIRYPWAWFAGVLQARADRTYYFGKYQGLQWPSLKEMADYALRQKALRAARDPGKRKRKSA